MQPVMGGTPMTFARTRDWFFRDGVLVWIERGASPAIRAWSASRSVNTLTASFNATFARVQAGSGFALIQPERTGPVLSWSGVGAGGTIVRADGGPYTMFITGNWVYFKTGVFVYRFTLG
jgi:hypothetical protein